MTNPASPTAPPPAPPGKYAWRAVPRADAPKRSIRDRIADFYDIYACLDEETAREQANRCIQCPAPTCVDGCPLHNRIPDWLALTAEGRFLEAAQLLQDSGCMSDIFARLCAHPCEVNCIIDARAEPVAINAIERFLHEYGLAHGVFDAPPPAPNGLRVAIMDAGPCGLVCAYDLVRRGYALTVFDAQPAAGGFLVKGVPAFKLEQTVVQRRIALLERLGVQFRLGPGGGQELRWADWRTHFDALFFGSCAEEVRPLDLPGGNLRNVFQGVTFVIQKTLEKPMDALPIETRNKRVVVLGGGDTAMNCLRTAIRCGATEAVCVYRRDEAHLPANRHEYLNAAEEGARFEFLAQPMELLGDEAGRATGVRCLKTRLGPADATGRPAPQSIAGTDFIVPADLVLVAYGFTATPFRVEAGLEEMALDAKGRVMVDHHFMTNIPGIFAGGSLVHGAGSVLANVRDARQAAAAIHQYLQAKGRRPS